MKIYSKFFLSTSAALLILAMCFIESKCFAQEKSFNTYRIGRLAKYAFKNENYYAAIELFKKRLEGDATATESNWYIAESYFALRQYGHAIPYYQKTYQNEKDNPTSDVKLKYGMALKMTAQYEEAKFMFLDFIKNCKGNKLNAYQQRIKKEIADCNFALEAKNDTSKFIAIPLDSNVNSANSDFAPCIYKEQLVFSSLPADSAISIDENNPEYVRLFLASKNKSGAWERHEFAEGPFNTQPTHTGNASFSSDGKKFYFTRCQIDEKNRMICAIYVSEKRANKWQEPIKLSEDINKPGYTNTQPYSVQIKKEEVLFFISDRPGGMGGKDIYAITYKAGRFSDLRNLGNKINTTGNEASPFYDAVNQILYFSSDGWKGYGGLDIYKAKGNLAKWKDAQNAGRPFNSATDDYYFVLDGNKNEGYFVSNRPQGRNKTGCCDDIYSFKPNTEKIINTSIENESISKNFQRDSTVIQNADTDRVDFSAITEIKKIKTSTTYTLNKIYFNYKEFNFMEEGKEELDKLYALLMQHPSYIIELSAHTDNRGSELYNLNLSQKRAESVKKYLVSKGIPEKRLFAKGYGENLPVADNENLDGSDYPEGRMKNRRTEFRILFSDEEESIK